MQRFLVILPPAWAAARVADRLRAVSPLLR